MARTDHSKMRYYWGALKLGVGEESMRSPFLVPAPPGACIAPQPNAYLSPYRPAMQAQPKGPAPSFNNDRN